ncbi:DNA polymerase III subunit gamma and tau [Georgenia sp. H159]|uniref:DNA polymerase III subunit gamma and tau n=1 Tax=Georgenia sp. H159 TaxID=3076115 RepID=UPI002D76771E|nr:DNA polymerase III subunit gamma and tau [Georgenia sp. H159]
MSTALYRRYRPETFADVIGQEHVTDPLRAALRSDRITHAYLFSGPRGCGKTTSARIFARCLNCVEGPTDTPCGTCPSCVELARGGAGSLDVVEMDAASHGGVDDARELRERAAFAPARDRYKVFIIDEAHMVTSQGFNALLKLVEEPPAHVKFVFATTEPEKVIGTIRSRTHHYPFRLLPPERLQAYLEELCAAEGVSVATGVLPLVVRAGGGSVRDSLSVLDQLIAGAQDGEVSYERAVALLGYTHATLLDDVVDALAARDGASLFRVVDRVIDSGHDPRRFAEDLLERIRDLVVIAVSGEHAATVLRSLPKDQFERMRVQSQQLGPAELSRAGDLVNDALTEMSGATSPRLQLELMCARLLLPGADDAARGHAARLDRIERHLSGGSTAPQAAGPQTSPASAAPAASAHGASGSAASGPGGRAPAGHAGAGERPAAEGGAPADRERAATPSTPAPADAHSAHPGHATSVSAPADPATDSASTVPAQGTAPGGAPTSTAADTARPAHVTEADEAVDDTPAPPTPNGGRTAQVGAPSRPAEGVSAPSGVSDLPSEPGAPEQEPAPWASEAAGPVRPRSQEPAASPSRPTSPAPSADADLIRRRWSEVLATLAQFKRSTWALVSQNAQVGEVSGGVLHLAFATSGLAHTFRNGAHVEPLQRALLETLGVQLRIEPVLSQAAESGGQGGAPYAASETPADAWTGSSAGGFTAAPGAGRDAGGWSPGPAPTGGQPGGAPTPSTADAGPAAAGPGAGAGAWSTQSAPSPTEAASPGAASSSPSHQPPGGRAEAGPAAAGVGDMAPRGAGTPPEPPVARVALADDTPSRDDPDAENSGMVGAPLIERMLGGTIISEE